MARGEYRGTAQRRAQIIDAAFEEFADGGYEQASLRSIANTAGITHSGLLYHFGSKEELLVEVLREHEEEERRQFFKREAPRNVEDFIDRMVESFRGELRRSQLLRLRMHFASGNGTERSHLVARDWMDRRYERIVREMAAQVGIFKASGAVASDLDDDDAAAAIFALYDGLLMHSLNAPGTDVSEIFAESLTHLLGS